MAISSRNKISVQFSMSGMTDIVFLLLIFFMLSSTLVAPKLLNLLPRSSTSKDNPLVEKIQVQIDFNSAGQLTYSYDKVRAASFEDFRTHVENRRMEKREVTIAIYADDQVPIQDIVDVIDVANQNDCAVVLATNRK